jgi:AraC family transcriptional regulator of adaptative response/methylated-DNA-[protein]-cysteine methyltransferase
MTFQAFARSRRLTGALPLVQGGLPLDDAVFESGFDSHSGFREAFARIFGEPPGAMRGCQCVLLTWIASPLGPLVAGATSEGICLLEFSDPPRLDPQLAVVRRLFGAAVVPGTNEHLEKLQAEMHAYFAGTLRRFSVPLCWPGTQFQQCVWEQLLTIPYGQTRSYEQVAAAIGAPRAVRAVGRANGQNRIAILIPCHRVVNKSGQLGGYGGGLRRKEYLLNLERSAGVK